MISRATNEACFKLFNNLIIYTKTRFKCVIKIDVIACDKIKDDEEHH